MKISVEQLEVLKAQHGKVWVISFNDTESEEGTSADYDTEYPSCDFAFKKMDFDLFAASAAIAMDKPIQAIKMQMEATMVFGDKTYLQDPVVLGSLAAEFSKITRARTAKLKKN